MRILIATDGSDFSNAAIDKACDLINLDKSAVKVVSVFEYVTPMLPPEATISPEFYQQIEVGLEETAAAHAARAEERIGKNLGERKAEISSAVIHGFPDQRIVDAAKDW